MFDAVFSDARVGTKLEEMTEMTVLKDRFLKVSALPFNRFIALCIAVRSLFIEFVRT